MDLTILIPSFKREIQFRNILKYYSNLNFKGKLIIGEGSNKSTFNKKKKFLKNYQNIDIKYFYAPGFVFQTVKSISKHIETSNVVFSGDDDYLVPKNINKLIKFLEVNKTYSGVFGDAYVFEIVKNYMFGQHKYHLLANKKINSFKRINFHLSKNYTVNIFAIQKKNNFLKMLNYCVDKRSEFKCPERAFSEEYLPTTMLSALGKYAYIKNYYLIRTVGHQRIQQKTKFDSHEDKISINYLYNSLKKEVVKKNHKNLKKIIYDFFYNQNFVRNKKILKILIDKILNLIKNYSPIIASLIYEIKYLNNPYRNYVKKNILKLTNND